MKMVTGDNDYDVGGNHAGDDSGGNQQVDENDDEDAWEEQCDGKHDADGFCGNQQEDDYNDKDAWEEQGLEPQEQGQGRQRPPLRSV